MTFKRKEYLPLPEERMDRLLAEVKPGNAAHTLLRIISSMDKLGITGPKGETLICVPSPEQKAMARQVLMPPQFRANVKQPAPAAKVQANSIARKNR